MGDTSQHTYIVISHKIKINKVRVYWMLQSKLNLSQVNQPWSWMCLSSELIELIIGLVAKPNHRFAFRSKEYQRVSANRKTYLCRDEVSQKCETLGGKFCETGSISVTLVSLGYYDKFDPFDEAYAVCAKNKLSSTNFCITRSK